MLAPRCPQCGSTNMSVVSEVWLDFTDGTPELDPNDGEYAQPFKAPDDTNALCRDCEHEFVID